MAQMICIYNLKEDSKQIELIQRATLTTEDFGLDPQPALFGSEEWWAAVEGGDLPTHVAEGVVSAVRWSSMGDWPTFEIRSPEGVKSSWTRLRQYTRFVVGLRATVKYVIQHGRGNNSLMDNSIPLEMWLEESSRRSEKKIPGPDGVLSRRSIEAVEVTPEGE